MTGLPVRRTAAVLVAGCLLFSTTACTGDSESAASPSPSPSPSRSQPGSSSASAPVAASVPLRVEVTHVAGRLAYRDRRALRARVGATVSAYVRAAFLGGDYPRTDFGGSFGAFTSGVEKQARGDRDLLTNQVFGATTRSVRATRRTAYVSVLAPRAEVAGVTVAVDLVFVVDRGDQPAQRSHLTGRLLLTREKSGWWAIFGYDLDRSDAPVRSGT